MPKLPSPRPSAGNAPGWREALLEGELAAYAAGRINALAELIGGAFAFAADHPGAAMLYGLSAAYDAAGALWDTLAPAVGEALTDINKKVFEEGWFGREVTPREVDISREPSPVETRMGFRELVAMQAAMLPNTPEMAAQARQEPEHGPEM